LRARSEGGRLAWALVRCALYGRCGNKATEEHGDLLDALSELQTSFPDKPAEWFYRAVYRLLAGRVERVGNERWLVKGLPEMGDTYPWYNVWVSGGKYRCDCFSSLRLRAQGEALQPHRHSHAPQEATPVPRRIILKAA